MFIGVQAVEPIKEYLDVRDLMPINIGKLVFDDMIDENDIF